jgi:YHS domain-containing protein
MNDAYDLDRKIDERLAAHQERRTAAGRRTVEAMHDLNRRIDLFATLADRLTKHVIWPRLVKLATHFDNAELPPESERDGHRSVCTFRRTQRCPATATLELGIGRCGGIENVIVYYSLTIIPVFIRFDGQDQLVMPLEQVDEARVAAWVEEKLLGFLDVYFELETDDHYQKENLVTDPVCGMSINKAYAVEQVEYLGQTYFFCVPECCRKFVADPDTYVGAGRQT